MKKLILSLTLVGSLCAIALAGDIPGSGKGSTPTPTPTPAVSSVSPKNETVDTPTTFEKVIWEIYLTLLGV